MNLFVTRELSLAMSAVLHIIIAPLLVHFIRFVVVFSHFDYFDNS